jgi:hypothetical protein
MSYDKVVIRKMLKDLEELGEKKFFKEIMKEFNINKKIMLYYSKSRYIPVATLPRFNLIVSSKRGFISFYYNFYAFMHMRGTILPLVKDTMIFVARCVLSHEIGHILDESLPQNRKEHSGLIVNLTEKIIHHNIDIQNETESKTQLPIEVDNIIIQLKRNLIERETKAWDIGKQIIKFNNNNEEKLFYKMKEYALATYNYGDLATIVRDNNLETTIKFKKLLQGL